MHMYIIRIGLWIRKALWKPRIRKQTWSDSPGCNTGYERQYGWREKKSIESCMQSQFEREYRTNTFIQMAHVLSRISSSPTISTRICFSNQRKRKTGEDLERLGFKYVRLVFQVHLRTHIKVSMTVTWSRQQHQYKQLSAATKIQSWICKC